VIDERAVIHPSAKIASDVQIGPWTLIGPDVEIDSGCWIGPHVVINGPTRIGKNNKIYQFASVGEAPQDKRYQNEETRLEIGDHNTIREYCTLNRGTVQGASVTRIGSYNLLMANVHIAHDCVIGDRIVFANNTALAGHVIVKSYAILSGFTAIHQYCQIGEYSFISGGSLVTKDVPPYFLVTAGERRASATGINSEGLRRNGFSAEAITALQRAFRILYRKGLPLKEAMSQLQEMTATYPEVQLLVDFLFQSKRGIIA